MEASILSRSKRPPRRYISCQCRSSNCPLCSAAATSMPAAPSRRRCSSSSVGSTIWNAFSPRARPSLMKGSSTRYSSSGLRKNAQIWRYLPSVVLASRIGLSDLSLSCASVRSLSLIGSIFCLLDRTIARVVDHLSMSKRSTAAARLILRDGVHLEPFCSHSSR